MQLEEHCQDRYTKAITDMPNWITNYLNIPYRHLGNNLEKGIDCFNLCAAVIKNQTGEDLQYKTSDFCNIVEEDWYTKTHDPLFKAFDNPNYGMLKIEDNPQPFDIILMSIGSTNITNHCALFLGNGKMLQTMIDHVSWITPYGRWYKRYTTGIYRWKNFNF